jgi:hypothetical protein
LDWHNRFTYLTFPLVESFWVLLLWFIYRGKNWARLLLVGLVCFRLLVVVGAIPRMSGISMLQVASLGLQVILQVTAMLLLLSRAATKWFRKDNHAS